MTQTFWVPGPLPGLNEIIDACKGAGGTGRIYSAMKKKWTNDIVFHIKAARIRAVERAYLRFIWHEKNRQRNPDNVACGRKFILDAMVLGKILGNDGWGEVAGWNDAWVVSGKPGVEVHMFTSPVQ